MLGYFCLFVGWGWDFIAIPTLVKIHDMNDHSVCVGLGRIPGIRIKYKGTPMSPGKHQGVAVPKHWDPGCVTSPFIPRNFMRLVIVRKPLTEPTSVLKKLREHSA
jgi:hypothetical protein